MKCEKCKGGGWIPSKMYGPLECPECKGTGEVEDSPPEPTLADIITLLERQAKTCERIAKTLGKIAETIKDL